MDKVLQQAFQRIERTFDSSSAREWLKQLQILAAVNKGGRILRRIRQASHEEQLKDGLTEARFAVCLYGMGFEVEVEPLGKSGPDLRATCEAGSALVEITRLQSTDEDITEIDPDNIPEMLPVTGDVKRDIRRVRQKIAGKFPQLKTEDPSILVIWNDHDAIMDPHAKTAVHQLVLDSASGAASTPLELHFIVYGSKWASFPMHTQFYTYNLHVPESPFFHNWRLEWEKSTVGQLVQAALARWEKEKNTTSPSQ